MTQRGLDFVYLSDAPSKWECTLTKIKYIPTHLLTTVLDYQTAYASGDNVESVNTSVVILHDGRPCAVWPLIFKVNNSEIDTVSHCGTLQSPHFIAGLSRRTIDRVVVQCLSVINDLLAAFNVREWQSIDSFSDQRIDVSPWHKQLLRVAAQVGLQYELYLNLQNNIEGVRSVIRKSYRSLISSGSKIGTIHTLSVADVDVWTEFQQLHQQVAGRVTRTQATWDLQLKAIDEQDAFFIYLRNSSRIMIGGALFYVSRDEGLYAVGAYDRTQFDKPIGHVIQYAAIQEMLTKGVAWYKIGDRPFGHEQPKPSGKELSIAEFKEGFSSHLVPRFVFTHARP